MTKGVKGSGTKPSMIKQMEKAQKVESPIQKPASIVNYTRCRNCRSQKWEVIGDVGTKGERLFQCTFCKRILITKDIPKTTDPLATI